MNATAHVLASATIGGILFLYTRSAAVWVACFLSGFLMDLDHIFDYWANYGFRFRIKHFFYVFREEPLRKVFVLLHAWELVFLLLAIALWSGWHPVPTGLLAGVGNHMFFDQFFNKHSWPAYFLVYRAAVKFKGLKFHGPEEHARRVLEQESETARD